MAELFFNAGRARLASDITSGASTLTVRSGQGALFPSPSGGDFFRLVIEQGDPENPTKREIVYCTARSGDVLTITRAVEGTTAQAFNTGSRVEHRITAGMLESFRDALGLSRTRPVQFVGSTGISGGRNGYGSLASLTSSVSATSPALSTTSLLSSTCRFDITNPGAGSAIYGPNGVTTSGIIGLRGSSPGIGGFEMVFRFGLLGNPADMRAVIGVKAGASNFSLAATEPNDLTSTEFVGYGFRSDSGSSGFWSRYNSSGGGSVSSDVTGVTKNATSLYQIRIWSFNGDSRVLVELADLATGTRHIEALASNLPATSSALYFCAAVHSATSSNGLTVVGLWTF